MLLHLNNIIMENIKKYCSYKNCTSKHIALPPVANRRKNGAAHHEDWDNRTMHKKCFKEMKETEELEKQLIRFKVKFESLSD